MLDCEAPPRGGGERGEGSVGTGRGRRRREVERSPAEKKNLHICPPMQVLEDWVGLRPGRISLRLEREECVLGGKARPVVHNYGHGGSGMTLAWGCAGDVVAMLKGAAAS